MSVREPEPDGFRSFVARVERPLRQALVATFGLVDGREAAVDALSWAWEHWEQASGLEFPVGYLYRVGRSARRHFAGRPIPTEPTVSEPLDVAPELLPALRKLPEQQRCVVVLVGAYQWRQQEVADLLGISPSTVHAHLTRGMARLRDRLEVRDVC